MQQFLKREAALFTAPKAMIASPHRGVRLMAIGVFALVVHVFVGAVWRSTIPKAAGTASMGLTEAMLCLLFVAFMAALLVHQCLAIEHDAAEGAAQPQTAQALRHAHLWLLGVLYLVALWQTQPASAGDPQLSRMPVLLTSCALIMLIGSVAQGRYMQSYGARLTWLTLSLLVLALIWQAQPALAQEMQRSVARKVPPERAQAWLDAMRYVGWAFVGLAALNALRAMHLLWVQFVDETKNGICLTRGLLRQRPGQPQQAGQPQARPAQTPPQPATGSQPPLSTRDSEAFVPSCTFADLSGNDALKSSLLNAARKWRNDGRCDGPNGILLHGAPGTGKTVFSEALAGELKLKIVRANVSSVASRFINQTTEQLNDLFDAALRQAPCVLFIDEIESLLPDRSRIHRGEAEETKVVATFLSTVEKLRNGRVLLVAATNHKDQVDAAAIRQGRFDFHIEVPLPDLAARLALIQAQVTKADKRVHDDVLQRLARRWAGFNVKRIQEAAQRGCELAETRTVGMREFMRGLRAVQGNQLGVPETALRLRQLFFDAPVKQRLQQLAIQFARSDEIEAAGGAVTRGVIFYGPPGTGKTTMAQALAVESGMAFVHTSGKQLLSDERELARVRAKASDLRPAIVFIDEADDILADRQTSGLKVYTNELLATIDGAGEPMHDVVWMLATNHLGQLDDAVGRRFPTKIELPLPGLETVRDMVEAWAANVPNIDGDRQTWSERAARLLEGLSPSVITSVLNGARNQAAVQTVVSGRQAAITLQMVSDALAEMQA